MRNILDSRPRIRIGLVLISFTLLLGCAAPKGKPIASGEYFDQAQTQVRRLKESYQALTSLTAFSQVEWESRGRKESFDAAIILKQPNQLRIEILDDLGQQKGVLIADGTRVFWRNHESREEKVWDQDATALKKSLKLSLTVEEFLDRLLLKIPGSAVLEVRNPETNSPGTLEITGAQARLGIDSNPPILKFFEALKSPRKKSFRYRVEYDGYRHRQEWNYPEKISWMFRGPKAKVTLFLQAIELNPQIPEGRFRGQNL